MPATIEVKDVGVPQISLRDFDARRDEIRQQLMDAASDVGFFTLVDHPIALERVDAAFALADRFFSLPDAVKLKTPWNGKNMGYEKNAQIRPSTGYPDPKESLQMGFQLTRDQESSWPAEADCPGFRADAMRFMGEVRDLSVKVMQLFAEGVGLPMDTFTEGTVSPDDDGGDKNDSMTTLRMLKYSECEGKDFGPDYFRAGAHADFDVLTLLFQREGQDGLEVCPGKAITTEFGRGDTWTPIKVERGAIVVNVGDQLKRWSDDRLQSTFHRVRCPRPGENQHARFSLGFFNQARRDAVIQGPAKRYPPITGGEFLAQAMKRNYDAAMKKDKLETYEVKAETLEANKDFQVSGTGLERAKVGVPSAAVAA